MKYELIQKRVSSFNLAEQVFYNRGIDNPAHYLNTTDNDLYPPSLLDNIKDGVKMLAYHIVNNNKIFIQVDSDPDGFTSSAVLLNYLHRLFPAFVENNIMYRLQDGKEHGIIPETIPDGISLVIAPDSSSNSVKECAELRLRGIDILIADHHESDEVPKDVCIINNQLCGYPNKSLSGVGIVYKFCCCFDEMMGTNFANNYLDLTALGIISDVMDLRNYETKRIIDRGLSEIISPFMAEMINAQGYSINRHGGLDPYSVSFYITPLINATIRIGSPQEKRLVFDSMLEYKGINQIPSTKRGCKGQMEAMVTQAVRICSNCKSRQTKINEDNCKIIENIIKDNDLLKNKILFVTIPDGMTNSNLTGLIANALASKYNKPTLLLIDRGNFYSGSARNINKSDFIDFKDFCINSNLVDLAQGHQGAFGFAINKNNVENFIEYSNKELAQYAFEPCYKVDAIIYKEQIDAGELLEIAGLKQIWGQGIETPLFLFKDIKVSKKDIQLMARDKNPTLKITVNNIEFIKFKSSESEYEELCQNEYVSLNIIGKCEANTWNGKTNAQIIIEGYEIGSTIKYYF